MKAAYSTQARSRAVQERSVQTRSRILEAAIEVLTTYGYSGATTTRIQETARVTRGRLLHHFRSRDELLIAAVQQLAAARMGLLRERSTWPEDRHERLDAAIDAMWETHQQSYFWASSELWMAARHDDRLRAALLPRERALARLIHDTIRSFFGSELSELPNFRLLIDVLLTSMRGTAMTHALTGPSTSPQPLDEWKFVARSVLGMSTGTPAPQPAAPAGPLT
ncbi:TetR/AcrR family transcriptional regulator [Arthrobacter sp. B6]|uniref:TetR/AcrR family transcriptional regulator n=1 Tax=Arthrobacter sp. B6 TaxID=1570137 RepID=UPI000833E376|nr:TetR/AcrR family transcriptional regulator [Arthrobacter sp. B6]